MKLINIAIVGAGGISGVHVGGISKLSNANIVGIVDLNRERAEERAKICHAAVFEKLEDCLDQVDMVFVLTPPSSHKAISLQAIRAGKHVVVEKPISSTIEDAEIMVAEAAKYNVKLMVGFNMRFRTGFRKLKEIADSGKLGDTVTYWCQRMGLRVDSQNKWSTDPILMTGMSIQSLSHDIDMMRWIAGEPIDVRAQVQESRPHLPGFDDNANAVFALANGGIANFQASWSSHLAMNSRGVIGTKGTAYIRGSSLWDMDTFHWKTEDMNCEQIEVINDIKDVRSYMEQDKYFIDCVEQDLQPSVTGLDGLRALKVSYGILASHKQNQVISLKV